MAVFGLFWNCVAFVIVYLLRQRAYRYARIRKLHQLYAQRHGVPIPPLEHGFEKAPTSKQYPMTPYEAQQIVLDHSQLEMPFMATKSIEFALFLTYGIETIAKVLDSSRELVDSDKVGRRYVDTKLLLSAVSQYPLVGPGSGYQPDPNSPQKALDPRGAIALARINVQHSHYKSITNNDLLYTLSVFMIEPAKWAEKFEWRNLTPLEIRAYFVFWKEVGRRMGIENIPEELQEMLEWSQAYEAENMLPSPICAKVAKSTTNLFLFNLPKVLHPFADRVVAVLLTDRLRESIQVEKPPIWLKFFVFQLLYFRAWLIRNVFFPRWGTNRAIIVPKEPAFPPGYIFESDGSEAEKQSTKGNEENFAPRSHPAVFDYEPWYMPQAQGVSRVIHSLLVSCRILSRNQIPSPEFESHGYRLESLGPKRQQASPNFDEVRRRAEEIHGEKLEGPYAIGGAPRSRCPFAV